MILKQGNYFHLTNGQISYIIEVIDEHYLVHRYFGKGIRRWNDSGKVAYYKRSYNTEHGMGNISFDDFPFEFPYQGHGDYRIEAISIEQSDGISMLDLSYINYKIYKGKDNLNGLPSLRAEKEHAETLEIICEDQVAGVRVTLYYTIYHDQNVILRHQKLENIGTNYFYIHNIQSMSLELPSMNWDCISFYGAHAAEANLSRFPLHHGIQRMESRRGSSSPNYQPFFSIVSPDTNVSQGEIYAMHLVYSGNFLAQAEMDQFGCVRMQIGIHPDEFIWKLDPKAVFESPEAVLVYTDQGLNGMSHIFHRLYREHLIPKQFVNQNRPVLLNSWEAMYCDVTMDKLERQMKLAAKAGIELFVLDDGWFREGNTTYTSMGDWECNYEKLPGGIRQVAQMAHDMGMQFGLWFEPEAVGKRSKLYEKHPDWILHVSGYEPTEGRHEYLLDLSRQEIQDYLVDIICSYLKDGDIQYIKWDMNRPLTDVCSERLNGRQKGETAHRYVLGLYKILSRITSEYPEVLIEGCSSGGARFDPGMLYYVAQNWTSDNTDVLDRTCIQSGFSYLYPPILMGAHVSASPNHQTGRESSLSVRYQVARQFNLGYELNLECVDKNEVEEIRNQIEAYKVDRNWMKEGQFYHHDTNQNYVMWSTVSKNQEKCMAMVFRKRHDFFSSHEIFHFLGLNPHWDYYLEQDGKIYGGDELMRIGLSIPLEKRDQDATVWTLQKVGL